MTENPNRKIAFVLAASDHGTMIVNRFDYHMVDDNRGFGVGFDILNSSSFDRPGVELHRQDEGRHRGRNIGDACGIRLSPIDPNIGQGLVGLMNCNPIDSKFKHAVLKCRKPFT